MSERDTSWTIAPTLAFFGVFLVTALAWRDGGLDALGDRLQRGSSDDGAAAPAVAAGPAFVAKRPVVADTDEDTEATPPASSGSRRRGGQGLGGRERAAHRRLPRGRLPRRHARPLRAVGDGRLLPRRSPTRRPASSAARCACRGTATRSSRPTRSPAACARGCRASSATAARASCTSSPPHRFCGHEAITRGHERRRGTTHAISTMQTPDGLYGVGGATTETDGGTRDDQARRRQGHERRALLPRAAQGRHRDGHRRRRRGRARRHRGGRQAAPAARPATIAAGASKLEIATDGPRARCSASTSRTRAARSSTTSASSASNVKSFANNDPRALAAASSRIAARTS